MEPKYRFKDKHGNEYPDWETDMLENLFYTRNGYTPSKANPDFWNNGTIPWIRMEDIRENGRVLSDSIQHITDKAVKGGKLFPANTVIFATSATVGEHALLRVPALSNQRFTAIIPKFMDEKINMDFVYWQGFIIDKSIIENQLTSTMPVANMDLFKKYPFRVPSLPEQQKIADFLSTYDEKIAIQRERVEALERRKKGLLQKVFSQEIRFRADDGSEFPEWESVRFGDYVQINRGGSPRPIQDYITNDADGLNWIKIGDVSPKTNHIKSTKEKIKKSGLKKTREVHPGDLILSNSMSFGRPYIVDIDGCIHDGWLLISQYSKVFTKEFLCCLLISDRIKKQYIQFAAGSTVQNLNSDIVQNIRVTMPSLIEQQKIADFFTAIDDQITVERERLATMETIKKGLLQGLFC